jgi:hypothetical protein
MAPQLASNVKWNGNYWFGGDIITRKPLLAGIVAGVIAEWSLTEAHLGRVFAYMIGAKHPITMTMYESVKSFDVQRDLLQKVAAETLAERNYELLSAALIVLNRRAAVRHRFAHWIWGISADPEVDALLLVEPKHFWRLSIKQYSFHKKVGVVGSAQVSPSLMATINVHLPKLDHEHIYIYKEQDLLAEAARMRGAMLIADRLRRLVSQKGAPQRGTYRLLYTDADIRTALDRAKKAPPNSDPTPAAAPKKPPRKKAASKK